MIDRFSRAGDRVADLALVAQELATDEDTTRWGSLAEELAELGHPLPKRLGSRHTTPRLRYVEQQLQRHDAFEAITATAKAKWTKLLQQCRSDCLGLRQLTRLRAGPDGGR
jgi:hypothetical protein